MLNDKENITWLKTVVEQIKRALLKGIQITDQDGYTGLILFMVG